MATLYREDLKFHKAPKVEREPRLHDILCTKAEEWLKRQGCKVTFHDKFKAVTGTGEQPDAIGWRSGASIEGLGMISRERLMQWLKDNRDFVMAYIKVDSGVHIEGEGG